MRRLFGGLAVLLLAADRISDLGYVRSDAFHMR
jgi:hypothetical protein